MYVTFSQIYMYDQVSLNLKISITCKVQNLFYAPAIRRMVEGH